MEKVEKVLEDYRSLGRLAVKIIAYRFRIFTSVIVLSINSIFSAMYLTIGLLEKAGSLPRLPILDIFFWIIPFMLTLLLVFILFGIFKRAFLEIPKLIKPREKVRINVGLVFSIAYSLPFLIVYIAAPPLPFWDEYAWYYALLVGSLIVTLFYERPLSRAYPELSIKIFYTITVLLLLFSPIPVALTTLGIEGLASIASSLITTICYLVSALREIYRAERLT